jgi:hypothetical protein
VLALEAGGYFRQPAGWKPEREPLKASLGNELEDRADRDTLDGR